ncbi:MAG: hypothetical protein JWP97_5036 [Labilithrix sp.]|nr:hypothetical protein [Labilithrix sp.]
MKGYASFFVIAVMSLGLVFLLATRARAPHDVPDADPVVVESADAGDAGAADGALLAATDAAGAVDAAPAARPAERPLRVVTLGWELAAAGVAMTTAGVDAGGAGAIELAPETTLDAVEQRLARGGVDPVGADVAVLPLPAFVVAYDRLRALDPRAFAVVGFSHGREEIHAAPGVLQKAAPGADDLKMVALGPTSAGDATARAGGSESATLLGLFAVDLVGVPASRVRFLAPGAEGAKAANVSAIVRGAADERRLAFTSADASRFIPLVAIAAKKQIDDGEPRLRELTRAWLEGVDRAGKDASNVARRLANKEGLPLAAGVGAAPEVIALIDRLGQIAPAGLADQRNLMGSGARGPATIEALAQRQWALARAGGLTSSAAPSPLPVDERIVTVIAPAPSARGPSPDAADGGADAGAFAALPAGTTPLLTYRAEPSSDAAAVVAQIGLLSGVFERAAFRITAKGGEKAARLLAATARDRFELPAARLATANGEPAGAFAVVEVLALP